MSFQKHLMLKVATKPATTYHQHNSLSRRGLKRVRRVGLIILGSLVGLVGLALLVIYLGSELRLNQRYVIAVTPPQLKTDAATLARGKHLVEANTGCDYCHGANLAGQRFTDAPPFRLIASNLTGGTGGVGQSYSDEDWVRAIRYAVRPNGTPLLFMPYQGFAQLSDEDLAAIIAYLKSVPPVDNQPGTSALRLLGRALLLAGEYHLPAEQIKVVPTQPTAPSTSRTVEYGAYLAAIGNCRECHGPNLSGSLPLEPGGMPPLNLTPGGQLQFWSEADFIHAMRTGERPNGTTLSSDMPWRVLTRQTDDELGAIYRYLRSLPARPFGM